VPGSASAIGRIKVISQPSWSGSQGPTVAAKAFGDSTGTGAPTPGSALSPMRAHGLRFWVSVGFVGLALWVYHQLPE
jgi:hypothetical protein